MRILYNLAFIIFAVFYLPYLIVTKRYKYGMADRLGILSKRLKSVTSKKKVIWIHAVSVGEMKTAGILAPLLRKAFPSHLLVFSSVTHTGNKVAGEIVRGDEAVFYLPLDLSFIVDRVVRIVKPELFLCLETELWPNLISSLHRFNTKIILINGRISDRSYRGYRKIRPIVSRILNKFSLILMQSEEDKKRIMGLGAVKDKVFVTGNLKFDLPLSGSADKRRGIREKLMMGDEDILLAAGSTHKGEERKIIDSFLALKKEYNNLKLLIAPRHIERTQEIEEILTGCGLKPIRFSSLDEKGEVGREEKANCVFILDAIGELKAIYSASDIVFVGGSLVKKGGQNPIEPASLAKPIIFGKFTFNFQNVVKSFLENGAAIEVENKDGLYSAIRMLLDSPEERKKLGMNAEHTVSENSGSSRRIIDIISAI